MGFFSIVSFWWGIALAPILILFYLLKLKRKDQIVSSTFLWDELLQDVQANTFFQRLKANKLLILQLLFLFLLAAALARPFIHTAGLHGSRTVVILDTSASMKAEDIRGGRFNAARSAALNLVRGMHPGDQMMILVSGQSASVAVPFTRDTAVLKSAIQKISPSDTATDLREALLLATSMGDTRNQNNLIVIISDGACPSVEGIHLGKSTVRMIRIGKRCNNMAITAFDLRRDYHQHGQYQIFTCVHNFSSKTQTCTLEYSLNSELIDARQITVPAGKDKADVLQENSESSGMISAKIDCSDDLPADNQAYAFINPDHREKVLLVTNGSPFVEKALNSQEQVRLFAKKPSEYTPEDTQYDLMVFDRFCPKQLPSQNCLFINTGYFLLHVEKISKSQTAHIVDWSRNHSLMRYVNLNDLSITPSEVLKGPAWLQTVAESDQGSVILAGEHSGNRYAFLSFQADLSESQFPLRIAFPIFMANCLDYLGGNNSLEGPLQLKTGETVSIQTPSSIKKLIVKRPDGSQENLIPQNGTALYRDATQAGLYTVTGKDFRRVFAANLLNPQESNLTPRNIVLTQASGGTASRIKGPGSNREIWHGICFAGLILLMLEWFVYHRRI